MSINYLNGDLKEPQPLILNLQSEQNGIDFIHPSDNRGTLIFAARQRIILACPGKGNYLQGIYGLKQLSEIETVCVTGKIFITSSICFNFANVSCKFLPRHEARRTNKRCYKDATHVEIGFNLTKNFFRTIEVCRDDISMMTYWTKFKLTKNIGSSQLGFPRPRRWQAGNYYGKYKMDYLYKTKTQIGTIANLVGSQELANKYIKADKNLFMTKGHMTAKADFVYGIAQSSTFWFLNAAPQWQTFNGGNWNALEVDIRQFVAKRTSDLEVHTGVHGHMSLTDINGNKVPIYLYANGTERVIPVPLFYWKVIHDPVAKKATAFIGTNNPWAESITEDIIMCQNIAHKIKWLSWNPNNITKGISYACTVDDLRKAVPTVPLLTVTDILT